VEQIQLFLKSCRSKATRETYELLLRKYVEFIGENKLFDNPSESIVKFILKLRNEGRPSITIQNYLNSIKSFYKINDVVLNIYKIEKLMPERLKANRDKAYEDVQIRKMLSIADERMKVVILLMASSGIRMGALPDLKISSLEGNKLTVYENTKEEYFTFITPECQKAIDEYLEFRKRYGEIITQESWLLREQFDIRDKFKAKTPTPILHKTIQGHVRRLMLKAGIRHNGTKYKRQEIMTSHGFRKFFTTQLINSKTNSEIREMLLGHKIGLVSAYYRPTVQEMYAEYEKALDILTINEENRLRKKIETLTIEKSRLDRIEEKMLKMEQMYKK
jgi:integrase